MCLLPTLMTVAARAVVATGEACPQCDLGSVCMSDGLCLDCIDCWRSNIAPATSPCPAQCAPGSTVTRSAGVENVCVCVEINDSKVDQSSE